MDQVETKRLRFRRILARDSATLLKLYSTQGFMRFVPTAIHSSADADSYIANQLTQTYRQFGIGLHLLELKKGGLPIGICGLSQRGEPPAVDIGYGLFPEYGGAGYALEAAQATLVFARRKLQLSRVTAVVNKENERSIKLLVKLGFSFRAALELLPNGAELDLYRVDL